MLCRLSYSGVGSSLRGEVLAQNPIHAQTTRVQLGTDSLAERDRSILDLERSWWLTFRSKEEGIRAELGIAPSTYYRALHELIDQDAALAYDPLVVLRARRARSTRRRSRFGGKTVSSPPN